MAGRPQPKKARAKKRAPVKKVKHLSVSPGQAYEQSPPDLVTIERMQTALAQAEKQSRRLASLNRVAQAVSSTLNLNEILEIAAREIVSELNAHSCGVALMNADHTALEVVAFAGPPGEPSTVGISISLEGNIAAQRALINRQSMVIQAEENRLIQNEQADQVFRARGTASMLITPVIARDEVIGTFGTDTDDPARIFTSEDVELAFTIASQISGAIENARLFEETRHLLRESQAKKGITETLLAITQVLSKTLSLQDVFDVILRELQKVVPYDSSSLQIVQEDRLVIVGGRGFENFQSILGLAFELNDESNPGVQVLRSKRQRVLGDVSRHPSFISQTHGGGKIRGWIGAPLLFGDRAIGIITLDKYEADFYNAEYAELVMAFAAQAATAIENARLFDETQHLLKETHQAKETAEKQSRRLASLNRVAQAVSSTFNLNEILAIAAREIVSELNARSCGVTLMDPARIHLEVVAFAGREGEPSTMGIIIPLEGNAGTQKVIATRQPLVLTAEENLRIQSPRTHEVFRARGTTCLLITPLIVRDEVIGTFGTDTNDSARVFTSEDVELVSTIASQISGAIENARLFEETQRLLQITEKRAAELSAISTVSQALIVEPELDNTIQLIGSQMSEIFNADIVYVALIDPQTKLIYFPYQVGEDFTVLKFGEGLVSKIIETGEPLLINRNVGERALEIGAKPVGKEVLSYLGVPIKTSQSTIGVISVQSTTQEGIFNEDSLRLLTTIAANAGAALHNARLFSEALENLRQVEILTDAAQAIENNVYESAMVESVAMREDALGELARVFRKMADEVRLREQRLKRQLAQLHLDMEETELAKNETVALYVPMDRRQALATGKTLAEYVHGTALFADVWGFTALTETLTNELGLQRGAEEMTRHLNRVLTTLIDEVHRYGGSVISFGGDAITCWFDDLDLDGKPRPQTSLERAMASALAMQKGMGQFAAIITPNGKAIAITIKVALTTGPARRMLVGDRALHQIDVVAGSTLLALGNFKHEAQRGEIVIAAADLPMLEANFQVAGWHWHQEKRYAVITGLKKEIPASPWPELAKNAIPESKIRAWLHPIVFEKVRAGQSDMLSELRLATALFFKFGGLDYDHDPKAGTKLDLFIQWVEWVIVFHHGSIIQFTVDDKGSYIYVVFGAPIAHKDDTARAVATALELASPPDSLAYMTNLCMGLTSGQMRVGAYGGSAHRNYGAIGDRTNLAARLMIAASHSSATPPEGQNAIIFCNDSIYAAVQEHFEFEAMPPIRVKGKSELIAIYRPVRKRQAEGSDQDSLFERAQLIDGLSPINQLILKVASVIGQNFRLETLSALFPEEHTRQQLESHLQSLAESGFITSSSLEGANYAFTDTQTREAAYNLMLFAQRRQLHRAMAELLEQTLSSIPLYAEIAHHWKAADEFAKAVEYLEKAGEHAHKMGDSEAAARFFNESLVLNSEL